MRQDTGETGRAWHPAGFCAALRVAAAIVARLLDKEPCVWAIVGPGGLKPDRIFGTKVAAYRHMAAQGIPTTESGEWAEYEDGDPVARYMLQAIVPR